MADRRPGPGWWRIEELAPDGGGSETWPRMVADRSPGPGSAAAEVLLDAGDVGLEEGGRGGGDELAAVARRLVAAAGGGQLEPQVIQRVELPGIDLDGALPSVDRLGLAAGGRERGA